MKKEKNEDEVSPEAVQVRSDETPENPPAGDDVSEGNQKTEGSVPHFSQASSAAFDVFEKVVTHGSELLNKTGKVISADYSYVLSPYAAYLLRVAAVLAAILAPFSPIITLGNHGFYGWAQELIVNAVFAFFLLVIAEIVITQRDIARALENMKAERSSGEDENHD